MVTLLLWLGANALVVAALTPVVWLLCRLLRSRPAVGHLLWFLLLLKLVVPPVLSWPWSIEQFGNSTRLAPEVTAPVVVNTPVVLEDEGLLDLESELATSETIAMPVVSETRTSASVEPRLSIESLIVTGWAMGTTVLLGFMFVGLWRQRQIVRSAAIAPDYLVSAVGRIARQFNVRPPKVIVSERMTTPAVCCLGRPTLIWPATMNARNVVADCEGVLAHELAHLARRDHYFLYAEFAVMVCCWWNPLLWLIRRWLCETRELACDARALAAVEQPRGDYAQRLLNLSVSRPGLLLVAPAFGAGNLSRRFLKRRLIMVFDERVHGRTSVGGVLLAVALVAVGLPGLTLADPPGNPDAAPITAAAPAKASAPATAAATVTAAQSATSADSADSDASVGSEEPRTRTSRSSRLFKVIKSDELGSDKEAEIALDSGATIRIRKNEQGDLAVTVDETEVSELPRRRRIIVERTGAEQLGLESGRVSAATPRRVIGTSSNATIASPRPARSTNISSADFDREMLQSEVELAEVNLMEQRAKMEIVKQQGADAGQQTLAELGVRRAEIELRRAKLRQARGESDRPQRQLR